MELLPVKSFQETLHGGYCGPASLKMVFEYYGLEKGEGGVAEACNHNTELGVFAEIESWLKNKVPVIVNWFTPGRRDYMDSEMPDGHSSVVAGIDDEKIYLQDPEIGGIREIPRKEFLRVWFDFPGAAITKPEDIILRQIIIIRPKE